MGFRVWGLVSGFGGGVGCLEALGGSGFGGWVVCFFVFVFFFWGRGLVFGGLGEVPVLAAGTREGGG